MRLFVAVEMPPEYRDGLANLLENLRGRTVSKMGWTRPENWHLTLKFLGERQDAEAVASALDAVRHPCFLLRAGKAGFFPSQGAPRVMWLGLRKGGEECGRLAGLVDAALLPLGLAANDRPYRPHLTLGRIRKPAGDDWGAIAEEICGSQWPVVRVESFSLMQSELGPEGPSYTRVKSVPLGG